MNVSNDELNLLYELSKSGNEAANECLVHYIYGYTSDIARHKYYKLSDDDRQDMMQKVMIEFNMIISRYRFDKVASLKHFVAICLENAIINYYESLKKKNNDFLLASMDAPINGDDEFTLHSIIMARSIDVNPEASLRYSLLIDRLQRRVLEQYSNDHRIKPIYIIYVMTINGYSADEIAETVGKSIRYVYRKRALFRHFLTQVGMRYIDLK